MTELNCNFQALLSFIGGMATGAVLMFLSLLFAKDKD